MGYGKLVQAGAGPGITYGAGQKPKEARTETRLEG